MIFGEVAIGEAEGTVLAHSLTAGNLKLKKGTLLAPEHISALTGAGISQVTVLRLEAGDIDENTAASKLAEALCGPGLELSRPFTGRTNLVAETAGIVTIEADKIDRLNRIDEGLTVATVRPYQAVQSGDLAATVKVIPFAVAGAALDEALTQAGEGRAIALHPFRAAKVGLLQTSVQGMKASLAGKARKVTEERLAGLGSKVAAEERCGHDEAQVAAALNKLVAAGCDPIIVYAASAVADRRDVMPSGIAAAGGEIVHFGMPVDPGNLSLVARIGEVDVIVAPGSARSPRLHGFDWVLQRLLAGLPVGVEEITAMGVGGLLKEITIRPQPRSGPDAGATPTARIAALVLAAGRSARMGAVNKLLLEIDGKAMVTRAVEAAGASGAHQVVVVTGHEAGRVAGAIDGLDALIVNNPDYADGLSTSLKSGIEALGEGIDAVVVMLGDMPGIGAGEIDRLIEAFGQSEGRGICVSTSSGKRGNPVLWARRYFPDLMALHGDVGARHLIGEHGEDVI
ncbi:MAG: NTP transferase domain-containing protein, partial [Rhizobiales bacterium]|nr:NTP transferase domain-containing protein [Hyphomicrobiales bacterium]